MRKQKKVKNFVWGSDAIIKWETLDKKARLSPDQKNALFSHCETLLYNLILKRPHISYDFCESDTSFVFDKKKSDDYQVYDHAFGQGFSFVFLPFGLRYLEVKCCNEVPEGKNLRRRLC